MRSLLLLALLLPTVALGQTILDGPDAPMVLPTYSDGAFHLLLMNPATSNNANEGYVESVPELQGTPDPNVRFQGYKVFQVLDNTVTPDQLQNASYARLVSHSDLSDSVDQIFVLAYNAQLGGCTSLLMADGDNQGTEYEIEVPLNQFGPNLPFVEGEEYCFLAVAYGHNPYSIDTVCTGDQTYIQSQQLPNGALKPTCAMALNTSTQNTTSASTPSMSLFPNPATSKTTLRIHTDSGSGSYSLTVYNLIGMCVLSAKTGSVAQIDTQQLDAGVYFVRVADANGLELTRKLVVE